MAISKIDTLQGSIQDTVSAAITTVSTDMTAQHTALEAKISELKRQVNSLQEHIDEALNLNSTALQSTMAAQLNSVQKYVDDRMSSKIAGLKNDIAILQTNVTSIANNLENFQSIMVEKTDYLTNILKIFTGVTDCESDGDCDATYSYCCVGNVCTQSELPCDQ